MSKSTCKLEIPPKKKNCKLEQDPKTKYRRAFFSPNNSRTCLYMYQLNVHRPIIVTMTVIFMHVGYTFQKRKIVTMTHFLVYMIHVLVKINEILGRQTL